MDYQKTLNLPQTDFSMKANLVQREPAFLQKWEKEGLYAQIRQKAGSDSAKKFTLHDGPPYANGNIHIGHALNKILKDMIVKMKTMQGFDSWYIPGWDCHGLPIEHQLFKELKKRKDDVDIVDFRKKAHAYAMKYVGIQKQQFKRLGIFGEWDNPYLTLAPDYESWILKSFARLTEKGFVYRGLKPVNWCVECETALAEAEVEYKDDTSPSVYVKFKVTDPARFGLGSSGKPVYLLIWTTTPWTLLANVAVAVHPAYQYKLVDDPEHGILIMEESVEPTFKWRAKEFHPPILKRVDGRELDGVKYAHPFFDKRNNCRVIMADYVTKEDGTGLVHIAPGHGQEDFAAGIAHNLEIVVPVNSRGIFTEEAGVFAGQHVFKANSGIIEYLQAQGVLFAALTITHSYPHCWRCKKPIIFRATKQWFLKIDHDGLRGKLKDAIVRHVQWVPEAGRERILGMVVTRPDWCLSRQRHWGVPIPALACRGCQGEHKLFPEVIEHFAGLAREHGSDVWFERGVGDLIPKGFRCPDCGQAEFEKTFDILDVWFDSGVSHQAVVEPMLHQEIPVEMYLEGSDQHRGWFQSSLIPAVALEGKAPFQTVLTHGFVVDGQGRKMSKSLGNVIAPEDVIKDNGVDILRLWVASSNYNDDIRLSKEILERLVDAYRKIRNTVRFLLGNLNGYDPQKDEVGYDDLLELDQWALYRLAGVMEEVQAGYNAYDFSRVYKLIYSFCNEDLSTFYLDILKDRLYTSPAHSPERRSAQTVLYHILNHLVRVAAPILTFTADEIFLAMPKDARLQQRASVHLLEWLSPDPVWKNPKVAEKFQRLIALRPHVLKALEEKRREGMIGSSLEARVIFQVADQRDLNYLSRLQDVLPSVLIVSQVTIQPVDKVLKPVSEDFPKIDMIVEKAAGEKCSRCWNFSVAVGKDEQHPTLCDRCSKTVKTIYAASS